MYEFSKSYHYRDSKLSCTGERGVKIGQIEYKVKDVLHELEDKLGKE